MPGQGSAHTLQCAQSQLQLALKPGAEETQYPELWVFMEDPWQITVLKLPPLFSLSALCVFSLAIKLCLQPHPK